jgi:hypothetical protein
MRENRLYGSEGGEAKSLPYPYHGFAAAHSPICRGPSADVASSGTETTRLSWDFANRQSRGGMDCYATLAMTVGRDLTRQSQGGFRLSFTGCFGFFVARRDCEYGVGPARLPDNRVT